MAERGSCYDRSSDGLAGGPWQERRAAGAVRGVTGFGIAGAWPQGARVTAHVSGHVTGCSSCSTVEVQRITVIKQVQSHFFFLKDTDKLPPDRTEYIANFCGDRQ